VLNELLSMLVPDFLHVGVAETREGIRLTQWDVFAESRRSAFLGLRGGVDHGERPDNQAERDLLAFEDERFFDDGYWRYWIGSYQKLLWSLQLYEEVALIDADNTEDSVRWQARLTRTGLLHMQNASATITVYSLAGNDYVGYLRLRRQGLDVGGDGHAHIDDSLLRSWLSVAGACLPP
jgi:hypothetical protein